jgi:O-antigen/teichoic acid export membrane protein
MSLPVSPENLHLTSETQKFRTQMGHISRHSAVFFLGTLFRILAGYLFKVYLARTLGPEPLGIYTLGMTIVGFVGMFGGLGLPQAAVRFVAQYMASEKMDELRHFLVSGTGVIAATNLALGALVLWMGPWVAVRFYHTPTLTPYLKLFAVIMGLGALTSFLGKVLQGYKQVSRLTVLTDFIGTPLTMICSIVLIAWGAGLRGYVLAQVISAAVLLVILLRAVWKQTPSAARDFGKQIERPESQVFSFSATVMGIALMNFLVSQSDRVLIGFFRNARELGIYSVAAAMVAYVPVALQSVNQIFSPTIADLHTRGERQLLGRLYQTLTRWVLAFTLPLVMTMMAFAKPVMSIFGSDFQAGWLVLVIGTAGQLVNCGVGSVGLLLLMSGHERQLMKVQVAMTVMTVGLGMVFVPRWGIVGGAVSAATANVVVNVWNLLLVRRFLGFLPYNRSSWRLVFSTAVSVVVVIFSRAMLHGAHAWMTIGVGLLLAYGSFFGILLLSGLDEDDRLIGQAAWKRMKGFLPAIDVGAS